MPNPRPSPHVARDADRPMFSRRRRIVALLVVSGVIVTATCALIFGPARGARNDIAHVRTDLHASRSGIFETVATLRATLTRIAGQLRVAEESLAIQKKGLSIASDSERVARTTSDHTEELVRQTTAVATTVRQVVSALGPLNQLRGDINDVLKGVRAGVSLARTTLAVAEQTLSTGKAALKIAVETLDTLQQSKTIQQQLLAVARQTLEQTREIDRKIPLPPIFPDTAVNRHR